MGPVFRSRIVQRFLSFSLIAAGLLVGWFSVLVLIDVVTGHGSRAGDMLTAAFGLSLLVPSSVFLILGINHLKKLSQLTL
jgi:hypothetical protein